MKLRILAIAAVMASMCGVAMMSNGAYAEVTCPAGSIRGDSGDSANSYAECNIPVPEEGEKTLMERVIDILNVVVGVVGIVAIAVVIIGGILYVVSTGEPAKTQRAKNTILYGIVGLVISLLAFALVNFVLNSIFGGGSSSGDKDGKTGGETSETTGE